MIELYIPKLSELAFRKTMLSDESTMSYNKNYDIENKNYHPETGCIEFPEENWEKWHEHWTAHAPERFYAYIRRKSDGAFLGEVNYHYIPAKKYHETGIVIYAPFRGMGYSVPALRLLTEHAFGVSMVSALNTEFEIAREEVVAWRSYFSAGFRVANEENGRLSLMLTRDAWLDAILQTEEDEKDGEQDPYYSFRMMF